jgi:hypothetical protein
VRTVICHFKNEAYLLQWWLRHHVQLFDYGVMIDSGSTDGSADLVRQIAPHWRLVKSRCTELDMYLLGLEIETYEWELPPGWKITLTATEFLMPCRPLELIEREAEEDNRRGCSASGIFCVDPTPGREPDPNQPLPLQVPWGIDFNAITSPEAHPLWPFPMFNRFYHSLPVGMYMPGRHSSYHQDSKTRNPELMIFRFTLAPWNEAMLQRRLQMKSEIIDDDLKRGWGHNHIRNREQHQYEYERSRAYTADLYQHPFASKALKFCASLAEGRISEPAVSSPEKPQRNDSGRYPYEGRERMLETLGPYLSSEVAWTATNPTLSGELASIFATTPNIVKCLGYLPVYEATVPRDRPIRMLEIGVFRGGSLQMWRRYLHPDSVIVGIDIDKKTAQFDDPAKNVHVRIGAQQNISFLESVVSEFGPFDVIVDDGSHMTSHVVQTFQYLFPNGLAPGGAYVAEDLSAHYWEAFRDSPMSFFDFAKSLVDAMHAPYQIPGVGEINFRAGSAKRFKEVQVPLATVLIEKVELYDSIAIIHRANGYREMLCSVWR